MRKALIAAVVLCVAILPLTASAERLKLSPTNPFATPKVNLYEWVLTVRKALKIEPIKIDERNPFDPRFVVLLWIIGMNTQALAQLVEYCSIYPAPVTLEQLSKVSYFGSARTIAKLLIFFSFPDEASFASQLVVPQEDWMEYFTLYVK
ncbi:MAG: hypothetical protein QXY39_07280 [Thermofilaceae archaeon]